MNLITYKPFTPSLRHRIALDKTILLKKKKLNKLSIGLTQHGGRTNTGRTAIWHRGGGNKKLYRLIDLKRNLLNIRAIVQNIEYDPNRSAFIALIHYENNMFSYILAPKNLVIGNSIITKTTFTVIKIGNTLPLKHIPLGTLIYNIEIKPMQGGKIARAAGTYAQLMKENEKGYVLIRLKSGEYRLVLANCFATIGRVSNIEHQNIVYGKAGVSRWLGIRPTVRGEAMNPVDHPHGGRTRGGRPPVTPWGKITKDKPTRNKRHKNKLIIKRAVKR